ncbi:MAG TPA: SHOCT domain-containing protein [Actinomycetota bacterium]|nr:SHOCT domain-containing protein [Actinomycetota bacterium]
MGRKALGGLVIACALASAPAAGAQVKDDGLRQCFGDVISQKEAQMDCVKVGDGEWTPVGGSDPVSSAFGTFVFFVLLLSLVPAAAGAMFAKEAGVPAAGGFAIGLFGSWVGVIGLYLYGHSQRRGSPVIQVGRPAGTNAGTAAERLKTLKDLLDQGLITQAEYDERRAAAIETL